MDITVTLNGTRYDVNLNHPLDISIPVRFEGAQLSAFGAAPASKEPYETEGFTGAIAQGGSCNCDVYTFSPHLHGTHTECVGHISSNAIHVYDIIKDSLIPATLLTVTPEDNVITPAMLHHNHPDFSDALIIRTTPNSPDKTTRNYSDDLPPFFSAEAMTYITEQGVKHLLVDMPSVDRVDDEKLTGHHIFWGVTDGNNIDQTSASDKTITELIYVPDDIKDGAYLLNLQIAPFMGDAAPSRPVLYEVKP